MKTPHRQSSLFRKTAHVLTWGVFMVTVATAPVVGCEGGGSGGGGGGGRGGRRGGPGGGQGGGGTTSSSATASSQTTSSTPIVVPTDQLFGVYGPHQRALMQVQAQQVAIAQRTAMRRSQKQQQAENLNRLREQMAQYIESNPENPVPENLYEFRRIQRKEANQHATASRKATQVGASRGKS